MKKLLSKIFNSKSLYLALFFAPVLLQGCDQRPSDAEVRSLLQKFVAVKSCFVSALFDRFPREIRNDHFGGMDYNATKLSPFVNAGLLSHSSTIYDLTALGKTAYVPDEKALCFSDGYDILQVKSVSALETKGAWVNPNIEKLWAAVVVLKLKPIAEWAKSPDLKDASFQNQSALDETARTETVYILKLRNGDALSVDPNINLPHDVYIPEGY